MAIDYDRRVAPITPVTTLTDLGSNISYELIYLQFYSPYRFLNISPSKSVSYIMIGCKLCLMHSAHE